MCAPGPHAVVLVIRASSSFSEHTRRATEEHVELLGQEVWNHTMVLFTHGDWLGDTTIEEYIESEGEALLSLLEKCGNRYHVLDNSNKTDCTQVMMLLEKIENMMIENEPLKPRQSLDYIHRRKKREEERAEDRRMKVKKQRGLFHSQSERLFGLSEQIWNFGKSEIQILENSQIFCNKIKAIETL